MSSCNGSAENVGPENARPEYRLEDHFEGLENAGPENAGLDFEGLQFLRAAGHSVRNAEVFQVVDNNSSATDDDDTVAGDQHPSDAATAPAASDVTGTCEV